MDLQINMGLSLSQLPSSDLEMCIYRNYLRSKCPVLWNCEWFYFYHFCLRAYWTCSFSKSAGHCECFCCSWIWPTLAAMYSLNNGIKFCWYRLWAQHFSRRGYINNFNAGWCTFFTRALNCHKEISELTVGKSNENSPHCCLAKCHWTLC